ncbi:MAG TPA: glutathione peroxidase [Bacilli bacterium]
MTNSIYEIGVTSKTGQPHNLNEYKGYVLLFVNVASRCGFTPQYEGLENLNKTYRDKGLRILGIPSNDFGGQEPGSMQEIQEFCTLNYGVTFDLLGKEHIIGEDKHPLYVFLTSHADPKEDVRWNFEKFLVSKEGHVLNRFSSKVAPDDAELINQIERSL